MPQKQPKRAYYHETRDVCEGLPELLGRFPLRALLVARPGEKVILPAGPFPTELPLLNRLGFGPRPEDLVFVGNDGQVTSGDGDLEDTEVFPFSGTSVLAREFTERHGASFHAPAHEACLDANSKATFQRIANVLLQGCDQVAPFGEVSSLARAELIAFAYMRKHGKAIVKGVHSASGLQQVVVEPGVAPSFADLPRTVVVQQWVEHDYSPSLQCIITPDGDVRALSTTVQILDGNHHIGNRCPSQLPEWVLEGMQWRAYLLARGLAERGYWGVCGVDFLVRESDRTVLANEINARIPAPWYAWNASRRLLGEPLPFRMKSVQLAAGTAIGDIERVMGPMLFSRDASRNTGAGFVPFCFVPEHGFVYGVTYAPDQALLDEFASDVDARLAELAP